LVKVSLLFFYLRVFSRPGIRLAAKILLGLVVVSHLWIICARLTTCVPLEAVWNPQVKMKYCHPKEVFLSHEGINVGTDVLLVVLSLVALSKVSCSRKEKGAIGAIFFFAFG
jgi:hypothetical protein